MRRTAAAIVLAALCLFGQAHRDTYHSAYQAWRTAAPTLERDAQAGGDAFAASVEKTAAEAVRYGSARVAFAKQLADINAQTLAGLEASVVSDPQGISPKGLEQFVTAETASVARNADAFANDPDKGLQQLRQSLEKERVALTAIGAAIVVRQKAAADAAATVSPVVTAREKAIEADRALGIGLKQLSEDAGREAAAWVEYYRVLAEAAKGAAPAVSETSAPATPSQASSTASEVTASANPAPPNPVVNTPRPEDLPSRPATPAITPLPLVRYTGAWTYPTTNGMHHGAEPEFIDLVVHEEGGHATGTLFGRFKLPAGSTGDPVIRFDFAGDFKNTRNQSFDLETSDGAKGTIELIPGPAFNLLEINFQTEQKPGKIRQANVVLIKK